MLPSRDVARFWSKVEMPNADRKGPLGDSCWLWKGIIRVGRYGKGLPYGRFKAKVDGKWSRLTAHHIAYELTHGPIPDEVFVLHECDNPICVNPDHLFLGTKADNNRDRAKKGRSARGENHPKSKLVPEQVLEIRRLNREEGWTHRKLATHFGVGKGSIQGILNGSHWSHLPNATEVP